MSTVSTVAPPSSRAIGLSAAAVTLLALTGCLLPGPSRQDTRPTAASTALSKEELADLLEQFEDTFDARIHDAAERLVTLRPDRRTRRMTLLWRTRVVPMARDALNQEDAVGSLLDVWALCLRMQQFFADGDGRALFGEHQHIAREVAEQCVRDVEAVAARVLTSETLAQARTAVEKLARRYPLRGEFTGAPVRTASEPPPPEGDIIQTILAAPMAPFRALEGIDRGAAAIAGFTAVAARMTDVINELPESVRLQAELFLLEAEELESIRLALAAAGTLADSSARLAGVAETLPEQLDEWPARLRSELAQLLDDLETRQGEIRRTVSEARALVAQVQATLAEVQSTSGPLGTVAAESARAGEAWTGAFQAFTQTVETLRAGGRGAAGQGGPGGGVASGGVAFNGVAGDRPAAKDGVAVRDGAADAAGAAAGASPGPPDALVQTRPSGPGQAPRPFDITDWTEAATSFAVAGEQMRALTAELRAFGDSEELRAALRQVEERLGGLLDRSESGARELTDRLTWRAALLIVLAFALAVLYRRLVAPRVRPPTPGAV